MKGRNYLTFILALLFIFSGCKKENNTEKGYSYYNLKKMGWKSKNHTVDIDNFSFKATEVPIMYYIAEEYGEENLDIINSVYEKEKHQRIIEFVVENKGLKDHFDEVYTNLDYKSSIEYFSFHIQKDFLLVTSRKDTILCEGVHFERSYNLTPYKKILLYFSGVDPDEELELIYNDSLFKKGQIKYKFNNHLIKL